MTTKTATNARRKPVVDFSDFEVALTKITGALDGLQKSQAEIASRLERHDSVLDDHHTAMLRLQTEAASRPSAMAFVGPIAAPVAMPATLLPGLSWFVDSTVSAQINKVDGRVAAVAQRVEADLPRLREQIFKLTENMTILKTKVEGNTREMSAHSSWFADRSRRSNGFYEQYQLFGDAKTKPNS